MVPHWPVESQVWTPFPEHLVSLCVQTPWQTPALHVWFVQVEVVSHAPEALQVWALLSKQRVPGEQDPIQTPPEQVLSTQAEAVSHWPFGPQVWVPLPEHLC